MLHCQPETNNNTPARNNDPLVVANMKQAAFRVSTLNFSFKIEELIFYFDFKLVSVMSSPPKLNFKHSCVICA